MGRPGAQLVADDGPRGLELLLVPMAGAFPGSGVHNVVGVLSGEPGTGLASRYRLVSIDRATVSQSAKTPGRIVGGSAGATS